MAIDGTPIAAKWLSDEDVECHEARLSRLKLLSKQESTASYWTFPGGLLAKSLFDEARHCFVYGQFLATVLLGLAYLERSLAALFYEAGRDDLQAAGLNKLLNEALADGLIDDNDYREMNRVRMKRNAYSHFRKPGHKESIEVRVLLEQETSYSIIEQDAAAVITVILRVVAKNAL